MTPDDVSVVIPNFNGAHLLPETLAALQSQTVQGFEVLVVDNGSSDGSLELLAQQGVQVLALPENLGFAGGANAGVSAVHRPLVAVLNSDARPEPCWLTELLAVAGSSPPEVWAWGSVLLQPDGRVESAGDAWRGTSAYKLLRDRSVDRLPLTPYEVFAPPGAAPLVRREVFVSLGGYDEQFFLYYEDVDLSFRARLAGHRALVVPTARVSHLGGATSKAKLERAWFHIARNSLWCVVRCSPDVPVRGLLRATHRELRTARQRGLGGAYLRGRVAGALGLPGQLRRRRRLQAERVVDPATLSAFLARQESFPALSP